MPAAAEAPLRPSARASSARPATAGSASRRQTPPAKARGRVRSLVRPALALVTLVLIADALVGENGWFERGREQDRLATTTATLERARQENAALETRKRRLEAGDPGTIEALARERLEMLKPGEVLFIDGTSRLPAAPSTASTLTAPR